MVHFDDILANRVVFGVLCSFVPDGRTQAYALISVLPNPFFAIAEALQELRADFRRFEEWQTDTIIAQVQEEALARDLRRDFWSLSDEERSD